MNVTNTGKVDGAAVPQLVSIPQLFQSELRIVHVIPQDRGRAAAQTFAGVRETIPESWREQDRGIRFGE